MRPGGNVAKIVVGVPFEVAPQQPLELAAYLIDQAGAVVSATPIKEGRFELELDEARVHGLNLAVAPVRKDLGKLPTRGQLEAMRAYEPTFALVRGTREYKLKPIPEALSKLWLLCACRVRGRVMKTTAIGGVTVDRPVCHARVHVCEVDPIRIVLPKLPDFQVFRLRDELLQAIRKPPFPRPPLGDPAPDVRPTERLSLPARAMKLQPHAGHAMAARPVAARPVEHETAGSGPQIEAALMSESITSIRSALAHSIDLLRPYLCAWHWLYPWFTTCTEVRAVETDENGRFDVTIYHPCNDEPDLYFWVESVIDGAWTPVYQPNRLCSTHWNYDCSSEVVIRVTDPRVQGCGPVTSPRGKTVLVKTIGNDVSMGEILGSSGGASEGKVSGAVSAGLDSPFAGMLELRADFGEDLVASGVTRYRWSYRQVEDAAGTAVAGAPHVMTRRVVRRYRKMIAGRPIDLPFLLGPVDDNFFKVWNPITSPPPEPDATWQTTDDSHEDPVTGFFATGLLDPFRTRDPAAPHLDDDTAGLYELTLQLFHENGSLVNWTDEGISLFEVTTPAPFGTAIMDTMASPPERRLLDGAGKTIGFKLRVFVDNGLCDGGMFPVTAPAADGTLQPAGPCGFIDYANPPGSPHAIPNATISFRARQANDHAVFSFQVVRGSTGQIAVASTPGNTWVGASSANGFNRASSTWSKAVPITGPGSLTNGCPEGRGAFAETLSVVTTAINGWGRAVELDFHATPSAFALTPAGPGNPHP